MIKIPYFLFFLFSILFHAQDTDVTLSEINFYYRLKDKTVPENSDLSEEYFLLNIKGNQSTFCSTKQLIRDSISLEALKRFNKGSRVISFEGSPRTRFTSYIYKDHKTQNIEVIDNISKDNFRYSEAKLENWKVGNTTKVIEGYKCQNAEIKAFGRTFIAWFSTEIPISDGPYKFLGLPGLILELYDVEDKFHFTLVKYTPKEKVKINPEFYKFQKVKTTDKEKFYLAKKSYQETVVERARAMGIGIDENRAQQLRKKSTKKIEWIEKAL